MKITIDNFKDIIPNKDQSLCEGLLIDLAELNQLLDDNDEAYRQLYIDYNTEHTEYSPERIDPCPDYYGMFALRFEKNPYETVGDYMTINELDNALFLLINFTEFKLS